LLDDLLKDLLRTEGAELNLLRAVCLLLLSGLGAWLIGLFYRRFGSSMSNREVLARSFLPLAMTTTLIIFIVQSSIALSLGLVGALSIVRFRAAIKEPEELVYLFITIAVGLGFGASLKPGSPTSALTIAALAAILTCLAISRRIRGPEALPNFHLTLSSHDAALDLDSTLEAVGSHSQSAALKRYDRSPEGQEIALIVEFSSASQLSACNAALAKLQPQAALTFVENRNIL